jgi:hypothetical protein
MNRISNLALSVIFLFYATGVVRAQSGSDSTEINLKNCGRLVYNPDAFQLVRVKRKRAAYKSVAADQEDWGWLAALYDISEKQAKVGSLINSRWILTTAKKAKYAPFFSTLNTALF